LKFSYSIFEGNTMKVPIIVLGYGNFSADNKLLSVEKDHIPMVPIFTDPIAANAWRIEMSQILKSQFDDDRGLETLICTEPDKAIDMFNIIVKFGEIQFAMINPPPPQDDCPDESIKKLCEIIEDIQNEYQLEDSDSDFDSDSDSDFDSEENPNTE